MTPPANAAPCRASARHLPATRPSAQTLPPQLVSFDSYQRHCLSACAFYVLCGFPWFRCRLTLPLNVAAIAARISEQLHGRKNSRDAEEAPARQPPSSTTKATASVSAANINGEIYISDGDYIKDIEVNDLRNRYIVTKASTQKMVTTIALAVQSLLPRFLIS